MSIKPAVTAQALERDQSVAGRIAAALSERIVSGALSPGSRLMQDHIAEEFQASHVPVREAFRKQLTYPVLLDWKGAVVKEFGYTKGVANVYLIDRDGRILKHVTGPVADATARDLFRDVDRALETSRP